MYFLPDPVNYPGPNLRFHILSRVQIDIAEELKKLLRGRCEKMFKNYLFWPYFPNYCQHFLTTPKKSYISPTPRNFLPCMYGRMYYF